MFKYTVKRLFQMIIVLMVVTVVVFFLSNFLSDPVDALIDRATATAQDIAAIRAQLGLDLPILVQFKTLLLIFYTETSVNPTFTSSPCWS